MEALYLPSSLSSPQDIGEGKVTDDKGSQFLGLSHPSSLYSPISIPSKPSQVLATTLPASPQPLSPTESQPLSTLLLHTFVLFSFIYIFIYLPSLFTFFDIMKKGMMYSFLQRFKLLLRCIGKALEAIHTLGGKCI